MREESISPSYSGVYIVTAMEWEKAIVISADLDFAVSLRRLLIRCGYVRCCRFATSIENKDVLKMIKSDLKGKSMIIFFDIDNNGIEQVYLTRMVYCQAPIVGVTCENKEESEKKTENQILSWTDSNVILHMPFGWARWIESFRGLRPIESPDDLSAMIRRSIWRADKPVTAIFEQEVWPVIQDTKSALYANKGVRGKIGKLEKVAKRIFAAAPLYRSHGYGRVFDYMARLKVAKPETQKQLLEMIQAEIENVVREIDRITALSTKIRARWKIGDL